MDVLSKGIWLVVVSVTAFVIGSPVFFLVHLGMVSAVGIVLGRVPLRRFLRGISILLVLAVALFIFQVLFIHRGDVVLQLGPLDLYSAGIRQGLTTSLRIMLVSIAGLVFVWTTDPRDIILGLVHIGLPYRIAYAIFVAFQVVPLLYQQATVIREAHLVRGVAEVSGRIEAWKRYFVPLLAYSIRKAEVSAIAMDSRAFGILPHRTFVDEFRWSRTGLVFVAAFSAIEALLVVVAALSGGLLERYTGGML